MQQEGGSPYSRNDASAAVLGTFGSYRDVNKCVLDALYT